MRYKFMYDDKWVYVNGHDEEDIFDKFEEQEQQSVNGLRYALIRDGVARNKGKAKRAVLFEKQPIEETALKICYGKNIADVTSQFNAFMKENDDLAHSQSPNGISYQMQIDGNGEAHFSVFIVHTTKESHEKWNKWSERRNERIDIEVNKLLKDK